ncbi:LysR family transcriptional regulator [Rhizobium sp. 1AS11]|uniref:LysR family transcriptional regulator n=1 Tax=Rhizobium acaciae TaxID=2989736 RepID=UPI0022223C46|nr:LysR family transcriptional regulator [Rhizobium acaciae]MCW1411318.1 LysR family transcriptional regulator [Rhizobium acaciae]MCW1743270.1 LysR family transcriptional regulator [Rhizobium acaciae]
MNRPSIPQLEGFFWTARLGSVRKAADRLSITQPTLSLRLKQLESETSAPLFERQGRGLRLTRHGHLFFTRTATVLEAYSDLANLSGAREIEGPVRFGVAEGFAVACMPQLIANLRADFSLLRPEWVVATSDVLEQSLMNGDLDVAILVDPIGLRDVRLSALGVQTNDWVSCTELKDVGNTPGQLSQWTIVTTPPPTAMYRTTVGWFAGEKITPEKTCLCSSLNAALQLVAAGTGIGIFPSRVVDAYPLKGALRSIETVPCLNDGRVFFGDRSASDEARSHALLRTVERTANELRYFKPD